MRRTVSESSNDSEQACAPCVAVVVDADSVNVEHPSRLAGLDAERGQGEDRGAAWMKREI